MGRLRHEGVAQKERFFQHFWAIIHDEFRNYLRDNYPGLSDVQKEKMRVQFEVYYGSARFASSGKGEIGGAPANAHLAAAKRHARVILVSRCLFVCFCLFVVGVRRSMAAVELAQVCFMLL